MDLLAKTEERPCWADPFDLIIGLVHVYMKLMWRAIMHFAKQGSLFLTCQVDILPERNDGRTIVEKHTSRKNCEEWCPPNNDGCTN